MTNNGYNIIARSDDFNWAWTSVYEGNIYTGHYDSAEDSVIMKKY